MKQSIRKLAIKLAAVALTVPVLAGTLGILGRSAEDPEYYVVSYGKSITILTGNGLSAEALAQRSGYDADEYLYEVEACEGYTAVELFDALDVTVTADGETQVFRTTGGTVGELLSMAGVTVGEEDILSHAEGEPVTDEMEIRVHRVTYGEAVEEKTIAHGKKYEDSKDLEKGKEKTKTEGHDGLKRLTYRVKYLDGVETDRELIGEETVTEAVDTVILRGTKVKTTSSSTSKTGSTGSSSKNNSSGSGSSSSGSSGSGSSSASSSSSSSGSSSGTTTKQNGHTVTEVSGTILSSSGEELAYSKIIDIKAYAYSYSAGSITASGAPVQVGIVAMLRSTLPQGTHVYVVTNDGKYTYGPAVVGDVPGGDIIDLFFNTEEECYAFGVRQAKVYVLD